MVIVDDIRDRRATFQEMLPGYISLVQSMKYGYGRGGYGRGLAVALVQRCSTALVLPIKGQNFSNFLHNSSHAEAEEDKAGRGTLSISFRNASLKQEGGTGVDKTY